MLGTRPEAMKRFYKFVKLAEGDHTIVYRLLRQNQNNGVVDLTDEEIKILIKSAIEEESKIT